jgi:hypothetical protein
MRPPRLERVLCDTCHQIAELTNYRGGVYCRECLMDAPPSPRDENRRGAHKRLDPNRGEKACSK